jgi:DNA processing protein
MSIALAPINISSPRSVSPLIEMGAYEALWLEEGATFKKIAEKFKNSPGSIPSDFVPYETCMRTAQRTLDILGRRGISQFGVRVHGAGEYPEKLRDASYPVELLYFQGWWNLVETRSVAVVGTRKPTTQGKLRAAKIARHLVEDGHTVVSGLARGIDTEALTTAISAGGQVIAVIGTPLSEHYPPENAPLQDRIGQEFLLVSQVPICRHSLQKPPQNKIFFPERNVTMSALTEATVIVEAGETSGTLTQARAAIHQGRKLFILDSCFLDPQLTWPARFQRMGAIRVRKYEDIKRNLAP